MKVLICDDDIQFSNVLANDFKDYFFDKLNNVDIEIDYSQATAPPIA